jgi:hypothetical protein
MYLPVVKLSRWLVMLPPPQWLLGTRASSLPIRMSPRAMLSRGKRLEELRRARNLVMVEHLLVVVPVMVGLPTSVEVLVAVLGQLLLLQPRLVGQGLPLVSPVQPSVCHHRLGAMPVVLGVLTGAPYPCLTHLGRQCTCLLITACPCTCLPRTG